MSHSLSLCLTGGYVLRIFASEPIQLERIPRWHVTTLTGEWTKSTTTDSTGGPPRLLNSSDDLKATNSNPVPMMSTTKGTENPKWCQNPQYHLSIPPPPPHHNNATSTLTQEEIYLKIIVRRNDKISAGRYQQNQNNLSNNNSDSHGGQREPTVGFVVCKPEIQEEIKIHSTNIGKLRLNPFGEVMLSKPSTLKKKNKKILPIEMARTSGNGGTSGGIDTNEYKIIEKKRILDSLYFSQSTTFLNKIECCMYFPKLPYSWIPDGLILIPCLSEKHARGSYDLEVYSNVKINLKQLPEMKSRSIASEWSEGLCGGSHITSSSKKNPKFELILRSPPSTSGGGGNGKFSYGGGAAAAAAGGGYHSNSCKIKITLTRSGNQWKQMCRHDAVGSMIGYYIYHIVRTDHNNGNGGGQEQIRQIYESSFVPTDEMTTPDDFTLDYLTNPNEAYLIMPTTFAEGKQGSFVLTVSSDSDFTLNKEQASTGHK
jgi:hypothetical protein